MLDTAFLTTPIAHRALHDLAAGRPENSRAACEAAASAGFGIEIDIQPSADGRAMVFHDYDLSRLTGAKGRISDLSAEALGGIPLRGGEGGIPSLRDILDLVAGRVPLLIEIKDQDGAMGRNIGPLEASVSADLASYTGRVAVMSFNPHSAARFRRLAPSIATGLTTAAYHEADWGLLPAERRAALASLDAVEAHHLDFISHDHRDLGSERVARLRAKGLPVLCWTIRSDKEEEDARRHADNITFEGYLPAH